MLWIEGKRSMGKRECFYLNSSCTPVPGRNAIGQSECEHSLGKGRIIRIRGVFTCCTYWSGGFCYSQTETRREGTALVSSHAARGRGRGGRTLIDWSSPPTCTHCGKRGHVQRSGPLWVWADCLEPLLIVVEARVGRVSAITTAERTYTLSYCDYQSWWVFKGPKPTYANEYQHGSICFDASSGKHAASLYLPTRYLLLLSQKSLEFHGCYCCRWFYSHSSWYRNSRTYIYITWRSCPE